MRRAPAIAALLALGGTACQDYEVTRKRLFDTFVQNRRDAGLDILWVLDNSSSTIEEQEQLAATSGAFIEFMTGVELPFRLAAVTTDMEREDAGALLDGLILDQDSEDIADRFAGLVQVGEDGSIAERGLDAMVAAADPAGPNPEFATADSDLEIIVFTDEDDQSRLEPDEALAALREARPQRQIGVTGIIGDLPEGCSTLLAAADPGYRYAELVELSGGLLESICVADYQAMLQRVALHTLGLVDTFQLSAVPELSDIEVRVNGALIHRRDRHGWRYEAADNTIVFDGYAVPPPGSVIDIDYYEWFGPYSADTGLE